MVHEIKTYHIFVMAVNFNEVTLHFSVQAGHNDLKTVGRTEHALIHLVYSAVSQWDELLNLNRNSV